MASVKFYQHKESKGRTLILITFTFNQRRLRLSSGISLPKSSWDSEEQKAKPLKEFAEENGKLRKISSFLLDTYDELFSKGTSYTKEEIDLKVEQIKNAFHVYTGRKEGKVSEKVSLINYIETFQSRYQGKLNASHLKHYGGLKTHLEEFEKKEGFRVDFETIGKEFYLRFTKYLAASGLKPNTVGSHIKRLKRVMTEAVEDKVTSNQEHKKKEFKVIQEDPDTVYLTVKEIMALYEMKIEIPNKRIIRDIFVLNCFTGLRHSDWDKVTFDNIDGNNLIINKTQKTKEQVILPIKPLVMEILKKYGTLNIISNQKTNDALRWIGEQAFQNKIGTGNPKKWLEIRTHTARRSFATNAYIAGIPMRDIMQVTGHRTTESFLKYIRVTKLETAEKLKDHPFFS